MADMLAEVDTNVRRPASTIRTIKTESRRKTRVLSPVLSDERAAAAARPADVDTPMLDTPPVEMSFDVGESFAAAMEDHVPMSDALPSSPVTKAVERKAQVASREEVKEDEAEEALEVAQPVGHTGAASVTVNMAGSRPATKTKKTDYPTPASSSPIRSQADAIDASTWTDVTSKLNVMSSPAVSTGATGKLSPQSVVEEDGSLRMFWLDYTEMNGSLCLIGKAKDKSSGHYVSCLVKIDNILRKLYFLPRESRHQHGRDTGEEVSMSDVYDEVDALMTKSRVSMHKIKPCTRKYAFELADVPKEADYLKLLYGYDKAPLPADLTGETFSHVFGTNTALFEQFVLWKNIMGPCWLKIGGADFQAVNNASWCKLELQVSQPSLISTLQDSDNLEAPPLTLMSISLRTTFNAKENKQEILVASAMVYENVSLTDTTPAEELPCKSFTVMRPNGSSFPTGFRAEVEKQKGGIQLKKTEQELLSLFLFQLQRHDPDVLIGHRLDDVDFSVLLNRMRERKTPGWHRIGRLRRSDWPRNMGKGGGSFFVERQLASGRLLCDLANDLGKVRPTREI